MRRAPLVGLAVFASLVVACKGTPEPPRREPPPVVAVALDAPAAIDVAAEIQKLVGPEQARRDAMTKLGKSNDPRAVAALLPLLEDDYAATALGQLGKLSLGPLSQMLEDPDPKRRLRAVQTIGFIRDPQIVDVLLPLLEVKDPELRLAVHLALGNAHDVRVARAAIPHLGSKDDEFAWVFLLETTGAPAVEPTIEALRHPSPRVRTGAAQALFHLKDRRAIEPLRAALNDTDPAVRSQAIASLSSFNDPGLQDALLPMLQDPEPRVRTAALLTIKDARAVPALVKMLAGRDSRTRDLAAEALGRIREPSATEPLVAALRSESDRFSRRYITTALAALGQPVLASVIPLLDDRQERMRHDAALVLASIDHPDARDALRGPLDRKDLMAVAGGAKHYCTLRTPEVDELLIAALAKARDEDLARELLNCHNQVLEDAATQWAKKHGYKIEVLFTPAQ